MVAIKSVGMTPIVRSLLKAAQLFLITSISVIVEPKEETEVVVVLVWAVLCLFTTAALLLAIVLSAITKLLVVTVTPVAPAVV